MARLNKAYFDALKELYDRGNIVSPRGLKSLEIIPWSMTIDDPVNDNTVRIPGFETNPEYATEELNWFYANTNRLDWSPKIKRTWSPYSDDGEHVNSSYGYRIFGGHPDFPDQWEWVKQKLRTDRDSRQAVININYPGDKKITKDFPCTESIQVFIRDDKLIWLTNMRSQDIYFGMRNDIFCFTNMQARLAGELGTDVGKYHHSCGSLHIYEKHFDKLERVMLGFKLGEINPDKL